MEETESRTETEELTEAVITARIEEFLSQC